MLMKLLRFRQVGNICFKAPRMASKSSWTLSSSVADMHISLLSSSVLLVTPLASAQLNLWARASKKIYFGTATDNPELIDAPYVKQLKNTQDFGQLIPVCHIIIPN